MTPLSLYGNLVAAQLFGVKVALQDDFAGTLKQLSAMGYTDVELSSFKGFAGDTLRGDFGKLSQLTVDEIRNPLQDAGLTSRCCQFKPTELDGPQIDATMEWAAALGIKCFTLVDVYFSNAEWQPAFDSLNRYGEQLRNNGFQLALHTPNDFWTQCNGETAFHAMLREVPAANCSIELDLSATLLNGVEPGECMASHPDRFCALHLRDGKKPPPEAMRYIPSLALGEGEIDFRSVLAGAKKAGVTYYIVEMIGFPPFDPIDAYRKSAEFIRNVRG